MDRHEHEPCSACTADMVREGRLVAERDAYREALRALVEALPKCNYVGCDRLAGWRMPYGPMCDEHKPPDADDYFALPHQDAAARAIALLKGPA